MKTSLLFQKTHKISRKAFYKYDVSKNIFGISNLIYNIEFFTHFIDSSFYGLKSITFDCNGEKFILCIN